MLLIASGKPTEALALVQQYRLRAPDDPLALELAGAALDAIHRREEALAEADQAVRTKKRWQGLMIRGGILLRLGLPAEALRDLEESYQLGGNLFTRMSIGTALVSLRRLDAAAALLHRSQRVVKYSFASVAAGDCQRLMGRHSRAAEAYERAAKFARREVDAGMPHQSILAYCLVQLGQDEEALDVASKALERQKGDVSALMTQALVKVRRGEIAEAEGKLRQMLAIAPQAAASALTDPQVSHLLSEKRFRELLAWALGAQRQTTDRIRAQFPHLFA